MAALNSPRNNCTDSEAVAFRKTVGRQKGRRLPARSLRKAMTVEAPNSWQWEPISPVIKDCATRHSGASRVCLTVIIADGVFMRSFARLCKLQGKVPDQPGLLGRGTPMTVCMCAEGLSSPKHLQLATRLKACKPFKCDQTSC